VAVFVVADQCVPPLMRGLVHRRQVTRLGEHERRIFHPLEPSAPLPDNRNQMWSIAIDGRDPFGQGRNMLRLHFAPADRGRVVFDLAWC
jgi:hypothetical protein